MNIDLKENELAMHFVCMAIGKDHHLIGEMSKVNETLNKDIVLTVDGVEVNFENIIKSMEEKYDKEVLHKAKALISNKIMDINTMLEDIEYKTSSILDGEEE